MGQVNPNDLRTTASLTAEGWSTKQIAQAVAAGQMSRHVRGVYGPADQGSEAHLVRCAAILARHSDAVALSHVSAAIAHGLPVQDANPTLVHLSTTRRGNGLRRSGYHLHVTDLPSHDIEHVDGLRVTSLARTVADVARTSPFVWAVAAVDHFLNRGGSRASLLRLIDEHPRWRGRRTLRQATIFGDGAAQSVAESASRVSIERAGLPAPTLQFQVIGPDGWVATSDFGWAEAKVVGEVDGAGKYGALLREGRTPQEAIMAEKRRDEEIRLAGFTPVHWDWRTAWDPVRLRALLGPQLMS